MSDTYIQRCDKGNPWPEFVDTAIHILEEKNGFVKYQRSFRNPGPTWIAGEIKVRPRSEFDEIFTKADWPFPW
jgi:hypothetical protein